MKVLAINSSACKDGNTAILLGRVLEELRKESIETELIQLAGQMIEPCKASWAWVSPASLRSRTPTAASLLFFFFTYSNDVY